MSWVASTLRPYRGIGETSAFLHKAVMRHEKGSEVFLVCSDTNLHEDELVHIDLES